MSSIGIQGAKAKLQMSNTVSTVSDERQGHIYGLATTTISYEQGMR